jgi:Zn-dependent protease
VHRSWRIGYFLDVPIEVQVSWPPVFVFVTWLLATRFFPQILPDLDRWSAWTVGFAASCLLFGSLLAHELAHAIVARRHGLEVSRISLFLLGGMAEIDVDHGTAGDELWLSLAGPVLSLILGGIGVSIWLAFVGYAPVLAVVAGYLAMSNALLAGFNLLPVFPLDGGRLVHAGLWRATGDWQRATCWASVLGQAGGALVLGIGAYLIAFDDGVSGAWLVAVGGYLIAAARAARPVAEPATSDAASEQITISP